MSLFGFAYQYLWPNSVWWGNNSITFLIWLTYFWVIYFTKSYLNTADNIPRLDKALSLFAYYAILGLILSIKFTYHTSILISSMSSVILVCLVVFSGIVCWRLGYKPAKYFMAAWIFFLIGTLVLSLRALGFLPINFFTAHGIMIGSVIEVSLLSLGLANRINLMKMEKELAQQAAKKEHLKFVMESEKNIRLEKKNVKLEKKIDRAKSNLKETETKHDDLKKELMDTEVKLIQAVKLSTLGQMSAGIVHEINNFINYISIAQFSIKTEVETVSKAINEILPDDEDTKEVRNYFEKSFSDMNLLLAQIKNGVKKLAEMSISLKNYSRLDPVPVKDSNIKHIVLEALTIMRIKINKLHVEKDLHPNIPLITCHPSHISQVIVNLISNAADSINEKIDHKDNFKKHFEGKLFIKIDNETVDSKEGVSIVIEDNGNGIPLEIRDNIMESFFTTKGVGMGTGLGLAITKKIIDEHYGSLTIQEAEKLGGARFKVWLPLL